MAGTTRYTAVLDANVLFPRFLRDVLLSLAHADMYSARWSEDIEREWKGNLAAKYGTAWEAIEATAAAMREAVPDCMVSGYEHLIPSIQLPDKGDRHVLAAAIAGHADCIVTFNEQDFPSEVLAKHGVELQTPDEFVVNQIMLHKIRALSALKRMRERWNKPEMTAQELVDLFAKRQMPLTAAHLADAVDLL